MSKVILTTAARLNKHGLHLGHYLGCFTPLTDIKEDYELYFVVNDISNISLGRGEKEDDLVNMVGDILSIDIPRNIKIFLQSEIIKHQQDFYAQVQIATTFKQLITAHPHKKRLASGGSFITVLDALFPLRDIVAYLSLETDYVLMNDDNSRVVNLTRKVSRKINTIMNSANYTNVLTQPQLISGRLPRILGYDYRKMCVKNNNAIYLTENIDTLRTKLEKTINTRFFNLYLENKFGVSFPAHFEPLEYFVPKRIAEICGDPKFFATFKTTLPGRYALETNSTELKERLYSIVDKTLLKFRLRKQMYNNNRALVLAKINDDSSYLEVLMNRFKDKIRQ